MYKIKSCIHGIKRVYKFVNYTGYSECTKPGTVNLKVCLPSLYNIWNSFTLGSKGNPKIEDNRCLESSLLNCGTCTN